MSDRTPQDQQADPPSIAAAIAELLRVMPGAGASFADQIAWFEHKAEVLERIAAHEFCDDRDTATRLAENSRRMAQALRDAEAGR